MSPIIITQMIREMYRYPGEGSIPEPLSRVSQPCRPASGPNDERRGSQCQPETKDLTIPQTEGRPPTSPPGHAPPLNRRPLRFTSLLSIVLHQRLMVTQLMMMARREAGVCQVTHGRLRGTGGGRSYHRSRYTGAPVEDPARLRYTEAPLEGPTRTRYTVVPLGGPCQVTVHCSTTVATLVVSQATVEPG